jgi:hypothetical protein
MSQPDKYAKNAKEWRNFAKINYKAAATLFASGNPFFILVAATLGHHALEMYLKAALICSGMIVFNPAKVGSLDPGLGISASDCAWDHALAALAETLAAKRKDFDLSAPLGLPESEVITFPKTLIEGLKLFDPFFYELRYPQELANIDGVSEEDGMVLDKLVALIEPFANRQ